MKLRKLRRAIYIPLAYAMLFCCGGCTKRVQVKDQTDTQIASAKHLDDTTAVESDKAKAETVSKTTGPVETDIHETDETFGWALPPPGVPNAKPQWLPVRRKTADKTIKAAATETEKQIDTQTHAAAGTHKIEDDTGKIATHTSEDDLTESDVAGFSWQIKLAILIGAIVLLIGVVAYFNPNLLGLPAKAVRWVLALLTRKPPAPPPEEPKP